MKQIVLNGSTYNIPENDSDDHGSVDDFLVALASLVALKASPTFTGVLGCPAYTLTTLPTVVVNGVIVVTNANTGAGTVCFGKGANWVDIKTGLAVA
jgi:hypothetical protein